MKQIWALNYSRCKYTVSVHFQFIYFWIHSSVQYSWNHLYTYNYERDSTLTKHNYHRWMNGRKRKLNGTPLLSFTLFNVIWLLTLFSWKCSFKSASGQSISTLRISFKGLLMILFCSWAGDSEKCQGQKSLL